MLRVGAGVVVFTSENWQPSSVCVFECAHTSCACMRGRCLKCHYTGATFGWPAFPSGEASWKAGFDYFLKQALNNQIPLWQHQLVPNSFWLQLHISAPHNLGIHTHTHKHPYPFNGISLVVMTEWLVVRWSWNGIKISRDSWFLQDPAGLKPDSS